MGKKEMIKALASHYTDGNKAAFARLLGISPQTLSSWETRDIFDAELIYKKCKDISAKWLLSCEGNMLETQPEAKNQYMSIGKDVKGNFQQGNGNYLILPKKDRNIEILEIKLKNLSSENDRLKKDIEDLRFTKNNLLAALNNNSNK